MKLITSSTILVLIVLGLVGCNAPDIRASESTATSVPVASAAISTSVSPTATRPPEVVLAPTSGAAFPITWKTREVKTVVIGNIRPDPHSSGQTRQSSTKTPRKSA